MYRYCYPAPSDFSDEALFGSVKIGEEIKTYKRVYSTKDYTPWYYNNPKSKLLRDDPLPPCIFGVPIIDYLNNHTVRQLLHVPDYVQAWETCSSTCQYTSGYNAS